MVIPEDSTINANTGARSGTGVKIWAAFKERFDKVNGSRLYYLHKEIFTLTQGISYVSTYFTKLKDLWAKYDSILPPPSSATEYIEQLEYQRLLQFLMGLNDGFEQARSQILLMPTLSSIDKAYAMVVQDESSKMIAGNAYGQAGHTDPTALFTARPRRNYNLECEFCHLKGHTKIECYKLMKCEFCNKTGHRKENCYKIVGYPTDFKQKKKANAVMVDTTGQQDLRSPQATYQPGSSVETGQFFTKEQYNQLLQLLNKNSIGEASVNMAGKCFSGNISLCENLELCKWIVDTGATNHMTGDKSLLKNETSVGNSGQVQLPTGDQPLFLIWESVNSQEDLLSGRVKEIGKREEDLYILSAALGKKVNKAFAVTNKGSMDIWHKRTGHVPVQVLRRIPSLQEWAWVFLMRLKSDVIVLLKNFIAMVKTQFGKKIKVFRAGNGGEFFNSACEDLFQSHGIIHQSSCPYTPQQNRVVERRHRHILETARAIRFQGHLHIPSSILGYKSPYELLFCKPPLLTHLKVIGCLCFATNLINSDKFAPRAVRSVLLGYAAHQKGYRLLDLENKVFFIS
ncbi:PREDICTED: uncharacterized protein LOC109241171 [Nicotiana attenuata]|uniref:uncharacterized protein LOC109241171 n=1 Tax=Nicotiana attenuata TaxID=49451 RepID=UPI0009054EA0|nr:PREDICTED: uncharacterized protein LOC109241171 [Nicotiana attenuata]